MGGHPNVELLESRFEDFFELLEELSIFFGVGNIDKNADEIVAVKLARVFPQPTDYLRFG